MKSAPTLKELAKELKRSFYYDEEGEHTGVQALYAENVWGVACQLEALAESAPPAAERTALKELRMKVEALKYYNEAINDALSEIDASEGTKSE